MKYRIPKLISMFLCMIIGSEYQRALGADSCLIREMSTFGPVLPGGVALSGVNSLYIVARLNGLHPEIEDLAKQAKLRQEGSALLDLRQAATSLGLTTMIFQMSVSEWRELEPRAIIQLRSHKYVVVLAINPNSGIEVVDECVRKSLTEKDVLTQWCGAVLEVQRTAVTDIAPIQIAVAKEDDASPASRVKIPFGNIAGDQTYTRRLSVVNQSPYKIEISRIEASCGCVAAKSDVTSLSPGESAPVSVSFDTRGMDGEFEKHVLIYIAKSNGTSARLVAVLTGTIRAEERLFCTPALPVIKVNASEIAKPIRIVISRQGDALVKLLHVRVSDSCLKVTPLAVGASGVAADGIRVALQVSVEKPLTAGVNKATIYIETEGIVYRTLSVPIEISVVPELSANPSSIFLPDVDLSKISDRSVEIKLTTSAKRDFTVKSVKVVPEQLGAISYDTDPTRECAIRLKMNSSQRAAGEIVKGAITISTDDVFNPEVVVPLCVRFRSTASN